MTGDLRDLSLEELWRLFPVELKEYSSDYPRWFEAQKSELEKILRPAVILRLKDMLPECSICISGIQVTGMNCISGI
ncbi:MAG: hypothetical protein ACOCVC_06350, partial [Spirochaeta sp.]